MDYLRKVRELSSKVSDSLARLSSCSLSMTELATLIQIDYFHQMLVKHIDLVDRRLINGETIPHDDNVFSLFETYTHWINKGKTHPSVELGRKILITTDQYGLILHHKVMDQPVDKNETLSEVDTLFSLYGESAFSSISFDKAFHSRGDRELLEVFIPTVVMPKKGRLNEDDRQREGHPSFNPDYSSNGQVDKFLIDFLG